MHPNEDYLLAIFAKDFQIRSSLKDNTVVATVMANMGFHEAMEASGVAVHTTDVGDRHILKTLRENDWTLGGEQSGHIIFADKAETGDGILTGLQLVNCLKRSEADLHELAQSSMQKFPQLLRSVELKEELNKKNNILDRIQQYILEAESMFTNQGRILVRRSGTEPILRIMVEGKEESEVHHVANTLTKSINEALNLTD